MQRLIGAATHEDRPWQHAISGIAGRKRIENSSKNLGVDGAQISESVPVFGLYTVTSRALKDAVHAVLLPRRVTQNRSAPAPSEPHDPGWFPCHSRPRLRRFH